MKLEALSENTGLFPNTVYWIQVGKVFPKFQFTLLKTYLKTQKSNIILNKVVEYQGLKYFEFELKENFPTVIAIISILIGALSVIGLGFLANEIKHKVFRVKDLDKEKFGIPIFPIVVVGAVGVGIAIYFIVK